MNNRTENSSSDISFVQSRRNGIEKLAVSMLAISVILSIFLSYSLFDFLSLIKKLDSQELVLNKYSSLTSKLDDLENEENQLVNLYGQVSLLSKLKASGLDIQSLLKILELAILPDVVFKRIEYRPRAARSIIEVESENDNAIGQMIRSLEDQPRFVSVSILKKERSNDSDTANRYTVELKF